MKSNTNDSIPESRSNNRIRDMQTNPSGRQEIRAVSRTAVRPIVAVFFSSLGTEKQHFRCSVFKMNRMLCIYLRFHVSNKLIFDIRAYSY